MLLDLAGCRRARERLDGANINGEREIDLARFAHVRGMHSLIAAPARPRVAFRIRCAALRNKSVGAERKSLCAFGMHFAKLPL